MHSRSVPGPPTRRQQAGRSAFRRWPHGTPWPSVGTAPGGRRCPAPVAECSRKSARWAPVRTGRWARPRSPSGRAMLLWWPTTPTNTGRSASRGWVIAWRGRHRSDDVWAVGQDQAPGHLADPLILHYDGHAWSPTAVPVAGQTSLTAVACAGRDNVWAVGFQGSRGRTFRPVHPALRRVGVGRCRTARDRGAHRATGGRHRPSRRSGVGCRKGQLRSWRHRLHGPAGREHRGTPLRCACC
jgi:hypothetical protein